MFPFATFLGRTVTNKSDVSGTDGRHYCLSGLSLSSNFALSSFSGLTSAFDGAGGWFGKWSRTGYGNYFGTAGFGSSSRFCRFSIGRFCRSLYTY